MNIYQIIASSGRPPEDYIGREIINVYENDRGDICVGLFDAGAVKEKGYKFKYKTILLCSMLEETPNNLERMFKWIHDRARQRGVKIKENKQFGDTI